LQDFIKAKKDKLPLFSFSFCFSKKKQKGARDLIPRSLGGYLDLTVYYCSELLLNIVEHPMFGIKMNIAVIPRYEETVGLFLIYPELTRDLIARFYKGCSTLVVGGATCLCRQAGT
jgi:hypothetical protein